MVVSLKTKHSVEGKLIKPLIESKSIKRKKRAQKTHENRKIRVYTLNKIKKLALRRNVSRSNSAIFCDLAKRTCGRYESSAPVVTLDRTKFQ